VLGHWKSPVPARSLILIFCVLIVTMRTYAAVLARRAKEGAQLRPWFVEKSVGCEVRRRRS
jgi:hypothetical protein